MGKGGQNVNKVETAVRAIHVPTGTAVKVSNERSQQQNKKLAYERLILQLHRKNQQILIDAQTENWNRHSSLERGNPVKKSPVRFNFPSVSLNDTTVWYFCLRKF